MDAIEPRTPDEPLAASVLRLPEFSAVAQDLVEAGLDAFVDNAAVDAIPIVASVKALVRGAIGYREAWLSKKLVALLYGVGQVKERDLQRWRKRLEAEPDLQQTGERVLAVVDRVTSTWKAELIGHLFRLYLDGRCDRAAFLQASEMVDDALTDDLRYLVTEWSEGLDTAACKRLVSVGLMSDRESRLLLESSQPPTTSDLGALVRDAAPSRAY